MSCETGFILTVGEVSALYHKVFDNSVKTGSFIRQKFTLSSVSFLSCKIFID